MSATSAQDNLVQVPSSENRRHYPGLDGLRGVAVLLVFFQHYVFVRESLRWAWIGVRIFFVLSGFLITGILYDTRDAKRRWSVFYARRTLRIFPLYYAALLVGVLVYPVYHWELRPWQWLWPLYLQNYARFYWQSVPSDSVDHLFSTTFTHPQVSLLYGHFWSLCVEEQFYLVWPLVVFGVRRRSALMKICLAVIVLSPLVRLACSLTLPARLLDLGFEERFTLLQCDGLLLGAFFALWMRGPCPNLTRVAKQLLWALLAITITSEVLCPILFHRPLMPAIGNPIFASLGYSCVNVGSVALVLLAIDPNTILSRLLQRRSLRWIGTISYSFYVLHDMPHVFYHQLAMHVPKHNIATLVIAFVCTLALASLSFYFYERRFLNLKTRFVIRPTTQGKTFVQV